MYDVSYGLIEVTHGKINGEVFWTETIPHDIPFSFGYYVGIKPPNYPVPAIPLTVDWSIDPEGREPSHVYIERWNDDPDGILIAAWKEISPT